MSVSDITLVGWFHTLFCFVAMFAGARNLIAEKGTPAHRYAGQWYVASMVLLNVSALFIYEPRVSRGTKIDLAHFGPFHWLAIGTLVILALAYIAASRQNRGPFAYLHPICMVASYYLLIGGAVNEVYARVTVFTGLAVRTRGAAVGLTHFVLMVISFGILTYFVGKVAAYRARARSSAAAIAAE